MKRRICVVTGSRAEYGLLKPLMQELRNDKDLKLQIIATGMHLSREFGLTYKEIKKDGFLIDQKVDIALTSDTPVSVSRSMGLCMIKIAKAYERLKPDIIVVLGDRFEIFSAVAAAAVSRIPVAHIHGGEITRGAFDEAFRHSITKMSHLHFTAAKSYQRRVIQLGEGPKTVFNVGALGLDNINRLKLLTKSKLEKELNFKFAKHNLLVTFHSVTLEDKTSKRYFQTLLSVLDELSDTNLIFTKTNADTDGRIINELIDKYMSRHSNKAVAFASLGQLKYLSTMKFVDAVVGNSSSGIIEAPSFKIGTINIGDRQTGRIRAKSIIDCSPSKEAIRSAIKKLYSKEFQKALKDIVNPCAGAGVANRIKEILKNCDISNIIKKDFYDIDFIAKQKI